MDQQRSSPQGRISHPLDGEQDLRVLGMLSSWNLKCGIAEYSRYLREALENYGIKTEIFSNFEQRTLGEDDPLVFRCWDNTAATLNHLIHKLASRRIKRLLIQYHTAFYSFDVLASLIDQLTRLDVSVFVAHHITN